MNKPHRIAIIGAGRTGRGFVARFAANSGQKVRFIDQDQELVDKLNEDRAYTIHYFGGRMAPQRIEDVEAAAAGSEESIEWMAEAELIFTAVGESNLLEAAKLLAKALQVRESAARATPLYVVTCENGVHPGDTLQQALNETGANHEHVAVAESAIFCSTVPLPGTRLDIQSESYHELPYDSLALPEHMALPGMVAEPRFRELLQRKIYTYNCISACIAYLGALIGYEMYADAANDPDIRIVLSRVTQSLNQALAEKLQIDLASQETFANRAIEKFSDIHIKDDIARNARDVLRKLGPEERLIAPLRIMDEAGADTTGLSLAAAAALHYWEPSLDALLEKEDVVEVLKRVSGLGSDSKLVKRIMNFYYALEAQKEKKQFDFARLL